MPSWQFHRARMRTQGEDANLILHLLDSGVPEAHMKVRKITHTPEMATKIALITSMFNPEIPFMDALHDTLGHIEDDQLYNKIFYGGKRAKKQQSSTDETEEDVEE